MVMPDVVCFKLGDAIKELSEAGYDISRVSLTTQPRDESKEYDLGCRVLIVKEISANKVELLVCKPIEPLSS